MSVIAVVGASGRTGRAVVRHLVAAGHQVLAVSRRPREVQGAEPREADATDPRAVAAALSGADAVVVALGISENPLSVRVRGARTTSMAVRSAGTRAVIGAMREQGIERLVVLSSYGIGDSAAGLSLPMRAMFALLLAPQMRDHLAQEEAVRASGLAWTIARPVNLTDAPRDPIVADPAMRTVSMQVGRDQVAECLAHWAASRHDVHRTVALSS